MNKIIAPYGSWRSPITADLITAKTIGFVQHCIDGEDIYWSESHPLTKIRVIPGTTIWRARRPRRLEF